MRGKLLIAIAPVLLGGCAQQMLQASQGDCTAFGYQPGTDAFAACVQQRFSGRQQALSAGLANMGRQPVQSPMGVAILRSQTVRGAARICTYDRVGTPYVTTVGAAQLCPASLP